MTRSNPRPDATMWTFFYVVLTLVAARGVWTIGEGRGWWKKAIRDDKPDPDRKAGDADTSDGPSKNTDRTSASSISARKPGVRAPSTLPKLGPPVELADSSPNAGGTDSFLAKEKGTTLETETAKKSFVRKMAMKYEGSIPDGDVGASRSSADSGLRGAFQPAWGVRQRAISKESIGVAQDVGLTASDRTDESNVSKSTKKAASLNAIERHGMSSTPATKPDAPSNLITNTTLSIPRDTIAVDALTVSPVSEKSLQRASSSDEEKLALASQSTPTEEGTHKHKQGTEPDGVHGQTSGKRTSEPAIPTMKSEDSIRLPASNEGTTWASISSESSIVPSLVQPAARKDPLVGFQRNDPSEASSLLSDSRKPSVQSLLGESSFAEEFWQAVGIEDPTISASASPEMGRSTRPSNDAIAEPNALTSGDEDSPSQRSPTIQRHVSQRLSERKDSDRSVRKAASFSMDRRPTPGSRQSSYRPLPVVPQVSSPLIGSSESRETPSRRHSAGYGKELPSPADRDLAFETDADAEKDTSSDVSHGSAKTPDLPTVLNLNKRDLAVLPPLSTDHCGALTKLLLSRNRLASLPSTLFEQMPNLKVLDLSDNCLGRIPEGLDRLPNLLELNVASNGIDRVGSELGVCTGLRILSLGKNRLYEVTPEALAPLLHLCFLDLSSNFMRTVPLILHKRLPTLRRLILDDNPIEPSLLTLVNPLLSPSKRKSSRELQSGRVKSIILGGSRFKKEGSTVGQDEDDLYEYSLWADEDRESMTSFDSGVADMGISRILSRARMDDGPTSREYTQRPGSGESDSLGRRSESLGRLHPTSAYGIALRRLLNHLRDAYELAPVGQTKGRASADELQDAERAGLTPATSALIPTDALATPGSVTRVEVNIPAPPPTSSPSPERRGQIANEIVVTERTFVRELQALMELYVRPLRDQNIFSESEIRTVFGNVDDILALHEYTLLPALEEALASGAQPLGSVFQRLGSQLALYEPYYNNFDTANSFVTLLLTIANASGGSTNANSSQKKTLSDKRRRELKPMAKQYRQFVARAKANPLHASQISLQAYLILPVQRLPRYKMLLDTLLKATSPSDADYSACLEATRIVSRVVSNSNESKRQFEAVRNGTSLLGRIHVPENSPMSATSSPLSISSSSESPTEPGSDRKMLFSGEVRLVKFVERDAPHALNMLALIEKEIKKKAKKRAECERVDRLLEWRVGKVWKKFGADGDNSNSTAAITASPQHAQHSIDIFAPDSPSLSVETLSEHGIQPTSGLEYALHVIGSQLYWCTRRPTHSSSSSASSSRNRRRTLISEEMDRSPSATTAFIERQQQQQAGLPTASPVTRTSPPLVRRSQSESDFRHRPQIEEVLSDASNEAEFDLVRSLRGPALTATFLGNVSAVHALARVCDGTCAMYVVGGERAIRDLIAAVEKATVPPTVVVTL